MREKKIHFLSGLPRTGSTVLASILSQNPDIYATPTSPLYPLLVRTNETLNLLGVQYTYDQESINKDIYLGIINAFYAKRTESIIFDKHRMWPKHIEAMKEYFGKNPKIICPIRPIAEIITSYLVLANQDENNFIDVHLKKLKQPINNESRANLLWSEYLKEPYEALTQGVSKYPQHILLIQYRDIVFDLQKTLERIYNFCEITSFKHDKDTIINKHEETKDEAWGMKNLHIIRPKLEFKSKNPVSYLPQKVIEYFNQFDILWQT